MGKKLAAAGMAAALAVGGLTVAAVNPLGVAGAQDAPATTTTAPAGTGSAKADGPLKRALASLVADGTLTQAQADAVLAATRSEAEAGRAERKEHRQARRAATLDVIAKALGSTPEEVKADLKGGTSIAGQAKAKGVDRQVVDDALTKHLNATIDAAVQDGKITEERAAKAKEHVEQAVDRILDADGSGAGRRTLRDRIKERRGN